MQVVAGKDLGPKFFSLILIFLLSCLPISILFVNAIQVFYFQPNYFFFFSTPKIAYLLFIIGYSMFFIIFAVILYMMDSKVRLILIVLNISMFAIASFFIYQSFKCHSYLIEEGLKVKEPFVKEKYIEWNDIQKVTQINKNTTPYQLQFEIIGDKTYIFNLQSDFVLKRKAFYKLLRDQDVEIDSKEKN